MTTPLSQTNSPEIFAQIFEKISSFHFSRKNDNPSDSELLYSYSREIYRKSLLLNKPNFSKIFTILKTEGTLSFSICNDNTQFMLASEILAYHFKHELKKKIHLSPSSFFEYLNLLDTSNSSSQVTSSKRKEVKDLLTLIEKFNDIKTIKIQINLQQLEPEVYLKYVFMTMNLHWLFRNLIELKIDISNQRVSLVREECIYLVYSILYVIKHYLSESISAMNIVLNYSFSYEMCELMKNLQINGECFNMLDVITVTFPKMNILKVDINGMESENFIAMNNLIKMNTQISSLNVNLLPFDKKINLYNAKRLKRFYLHGCEMTDIRKYKKQQSDISYETVSDREYYFYFEKLCMLFKNNLYNLSEYIFGKENTPLLNNLKNFSIGFELIDFFNNSFTKLNDILYEYIIHLLINICTVQNKLIKMEINAPCLMLNYNNISLNYSTYEKLIEHRKAFLLKTLILNFRLFNFDNLNLFIPHNIKHLILGEVNITTLNNLMKHIDEFVFLEKLDLSIWNESNEYERNINVVKKFITYEKFPHKLNNVVLMLKMKFQYEDLEKLFMDLYEVKNNVENWDIVIYKNKIKMKETNKLMYMNENIIWKKNQSQNYISLREMEYSKKQTIINVLNSKKLLRAVCESQSIHHRLNILLTILKFLCIKEPFEISLDIA